MEEERKPTIREWAPLIVDYMRKRGMTVADLSKASGISKPSIYGLINGTTKKITSETAIAYIRALEIPESEISDFLDNL